MFVSFLTHILVLWLFAHFVKADSSSPVPETKLTVGVIDNEKLKSISDEIREKRHSDLPVQAKRRSETHQILVPVRRPEKPSVAPEKLLSRPRKVVGERVENGTTSKVSEVKKTTNPIEGLLQDKGETRFENPFRKLNLPQSEKILSNPDFSKTKLGKAGRRKLMKNFEKNDKALKTTLENFSKEVKPGNHTGVNKRVLRKKYNLSLGSTGAVKLTIGTTSVPIGDKYLAQIHDKIHPLWAKNYLGNLDLYEPINSVLNNSSLHTKLEFVIDANDGEVEKVNIVKSSGQLRFDAEAVSISHQIGPHSKAPKGVISPNGKVYVHWNFWRDQRRCGTQGATIYLVE